MFKIFSHLSSPVLSAVVTKSSFVRLLISDFKLSNCKSSASPKILNSLISPKTGGTGIINETVFENRFMQVPEFIKMGADITIEGRCAVVKGVETMKGAKVRATDLRAGAGLVITGLGAEGVTEITDIHYIDRGYENFDGKLRGIGADIIRINEQAVQ